MPTLLVWRGYKFRFYSSDRFEPPHVHIVKDGKAAKIWLRNLTLEYRHGFGEHEMRDIEAVVARHRDAWIGSWNGFFGL